MTPAEKAKATRAENAIRRHLLRYGWEAMTIAHEPGCWTVEASGHDDEIALVAPDYRGILRLIEAYR